MQKHTRLEVRQAPEGTGGRRDASTASGEQSSASSPRGEGLGAAPVERRRNEIAMARDVRQHGIRRTKFGTFSSGRRLGGRYRSSDAETKLPWRVTSGNTASGKQGLLPLLGEKASRDATTSQGKEGLAQAPPDEKNVHGRTLPCTFRVRWGFRQGGPGLDAAGACAGRGPCQTGLVSRRMGAAAGQLCWPWAG